MLGQATEFVWDQNTEPDIDGYKVYQCTTIPCLPVSGIQIGDVNHPDASFPIPSEGTGHVVVTAYDLDGNEGPASNSESFDKDAPAAVQNLRKE